MRIKEQLLEKEHKMELMLDIIKILMKVLEDYYKQMNLVLLIDQVKEE